MSILNITLPEGSTIYNCRQVVFKAPCDCKNVTGIQIDGVKYELLDAANNPINIGNSFTAGSIVSVIVDTENKKAYMQGGGEVEFNKFVEVAATKEYVDEAIEASGGAVVGSEAPTNTNLLWVDTANESVLKYYNGSTWVPIGAVWK